jgi:hypothetical protein
MWGALSHGCVDAYCSQTSHRQAMMNCSGDVVLVVEPLGYTSACPPQESDPGSDAAQLHPGSYGQRRSIDPNWALRGEHDASFPYFLQAKTQQQQHPLDGPSHLAFGATQHPSDEPMQLPSSAVSFKQPQIVTVEMIKDEAKAYQNTRRTSNIGFLRLCTMYAVLLAAHLQKYRDEKEQTLIAEFNKEAAGWMDADTLRKVKKRYQEAPVLWNTEPRRQFWLDVPVERFGNSPGPAGSYLTWLGQVTPKSGASEDDVLRFYDSVIVQMDRLGKHCTADKLREWHNEIRRRDGQFWRIEQTACSFLSGR